jgi:hypothetical protein
MTAALDGGEWSVAGPDHTLPTGKTRYPFYRRLGGPQGRSGRVEILVATGIRSGTVQLLAQSLYRLSYPAHLSTKFNVNYDGRSSSYRAGDTLPFGYKTNNFMLYKKIITLCHESHAQHINTLCGRNVEL